MSRSPWGKRILSGCLIALLALAVVSCMVFVVAGGLSSFVRDLGEKFIAQTPVIEQTPEPEFSGIEPVAGPQFTPVPIEFVFNEKSYTITPQVENDVYYGALEIPRIVNGKEGMSDAQRYHDFYQRFTFDPAQTPAIENVVQQLRAIRDKRRLDMVAYAELIIKYVQSVPYDASRLDDLKEGIVRQGDPRMPVQVLVDGTADCDEKVMLAIALLTHEGFDATMFRYDEEKHMALGIKSEGSGYRDTGYEFVELTGPGYVSEMPKELAGGIRLTSKPEELPFDSNGPYVYSQRAVDEIAFITHARDTALDAAARKKAYVESTPMTQEQFDAEKAQFDACYTAYNTLQVTVDKDGRPTTDNVFKDRLSALKWLTQHYWWQE